jgi:hypothetical protein
VASKYFVRLNHMPNQCIMMPELHFFKHTKNKNSLIELNHVQEDMLCVLPQQPKPLDLAFQILGCDHRHMGLPPKPKSATNGT